MALEDIGGADMDEVFPPWEDRPGHKTPLMLCEISSSHLAPSASYHTCRSPEVDARAIASISRASPVIRGLGKMASGVGTSFEDSGGEIPHSSFSEEERLDTSDYTNRFMEPPASRSERTRRAIANFCRKALSRKEIGHPAIV